MYKVYVNEAQKYIKVTAGGFIGVEEAQKLSDEFKASINKFKKGEVNLLFDLRDLKPASPDIIPIVKEIESLSNEWSNKYASIHASALTKMQIERTANEAGANEKIRRFSSEEEAMKYILE